MLRRLFCHRKTLGRWAALACWVAARAAWAAPASIEIGVLSVLGDEATAELWQPLADGLERALPGHAVRLQVFAPPALEAALQARALHFVVTNPGHYVQLEARHGASRVATQTIGDNTDPAHAVGSAVVVRSGTLLPATLADLRGRRVAAVAEHAFGGYQLVALEWLRSGVDAEAGAVRRLFTGFPMQHVADAVLAGRADAGILRTCVLEQLERSGRVPVGALTVVGARRDAPLGCRASTPLYPGWAFAALPGTAPELGRSVLLALLSQPADELGGRWSVPADYQRVHQVLRELHAEPYAFLRETRPKALLSRYWYLPAGVLALLLLGAAYMVHVELLVKRRTAELTRASAERERLAQQLARGQEAMDHLSRLSILGELSATLAHELSHPLATIANYAASVQRRAARGNLTPAALTQALQDMAQEAERATRVIASVRALARRRVSVRVASDPLALAQQAVALFGGLLREAPPIRIDCAPDCRQLRLPADPQQIQQVLLNLLKNSLDAHRAAGRPQAPITLRIERRGAQLVLAVEDQGAPLSEAERARLFEPFYTTRPDGLGLGLAICRGIAETHGGALRAQPAAADGGPGMVFELLLPLGADKAPAADTPDTPP